ncbi:MAG TPA: hypothetical protein VMV40_09400 [Acidiferrobacter sp.]|nr:hypothetical protein [Acidiferrobacter sp.]
MSGHYPFGGKANRVSAYAFFEKEGLSLDLQERYYKWWYDLAKNFVAQDPDLKVTRAVDFNHYPFGQHAGGNVRLHDYQWATALADLGAFVVNAVFPKLSSEALHKVEHDYAAMMKDLEGERDKAPRPAAPDVGRYRHI